MFEQPLTMLKHLIIKKEKRIDICSLKFSAFARELCKLCFAISSAPSESNADRNELFLGTMASLHKVYQDRGVVKEEEVALLVCGYIYMAYILIFTDANAYKT